MFSGLEAVDVRHGRRWTALASFVSQGILVTAAFVLPLLNPAILPDGFMRHRISLPISLSDPHIRTRQENIQQRGGTTSVVPIVVRNRFTYPSTHDNATSSFETPTPVIPNRDGVPNGRNDISNIFSGSIEKPLLHPSSITTKPLPLSLMMEGNLIHRVEPQYPAIARQIRLQGTVVLRAMIGSDGTIERIRVISGHPILAQAA